MGSEIGGFALPGGGAVEDGDLPATHVAEHVTADERGNLRAPVHAAADHGAPAVGMGIFVDRIRRPLRTRSLKLGPTLTEVPPKVQRAYGTTRAGRRNPIDLFDVTLTYVWHPYIPGDRIHGSSPWVA